MFQFTAKNLRVPTKRFYVMIHKLRDPNDVIFNRTGGCLDVGPACGGRGDVVTEMSAVKEA